MAASATPRLRTRPADEAACADLDAVFGSRGEASRCRCQRFKVRDTNWASVPVEERARRLRAQTGCGGAGSGATSGLLAYLDGEPVGWCAVEPRTAYVRLRRNRIVWADRHEDRDDADVWSATCFLARAGFRRRGVGYALARAAVPFARERGARALEGYPMITEPGRTVGVTEELRVGSRSMFAAAGFAEVSRPSLRRVVMRIDF